MAVTFTCLRVRQLQPRAGARLQSACGCARGRPAHLSAPLTVKKSVTRTMLPGSSAPLARAVLANETGMQLMPSLSDAAYTDSPLCKDTCLHNPNPAQAEARSKETNAISAAAGLLPHLQPCAPTRAQKQPYSAWQATQGPARLGSRVGPPRTHAAGRRAAPLGPRQDLLREAEGQDGRQDDQRGREVVEADSAVAVPPASREALSYREPKPRECSCDVSLGAGGLARAYLKNVIRKPKPAHQPRTAHN